MRVESISVQPSGTAAVTRAVPRKNFISSTVLPAANWWATSTSARSAFPNSNIFAFESIKTERLTLSLQ